jgi:hypothetical protein
VVIDTGTATCRCGTEIDVGDAEHWGDVFKALARHGVDDHGLPADEPWTDEMVEEAVGG